MTDETHFYEVPGSETTIGHGGQAYTVRQHQVKLPAAAWVTELEAQGTIKRAPDIPAESESRDVGPPPEVDTPAESESEIPEIFVQAGYATADDIRSATDTELLAISGVGKATLAQVREEIG
jgi:hypothetical protein